MCFGVGGWLGLVWGLILFIWNGLELGVTSKHSLSVHGCHGAEKVYLACGRVLSLGAVV